MKKKSITKITEDINLNERQLKMFDLYKKIYGRNVLLKHKNKYRVTDPSKVIII